MLAWVKCGHSTCRNGAWLQALPNNRLPSLPSADEAPPPDPSSQETAPRNGSAQPHSYQNPTTSSMAKMARSISVGENLGLASEPQAPAPARASPLTKLALPSRAHLVLDIPKPLPDRPSLATFSPATRARATVEAGQQEGMGRPPSATERRAWVAEGAAPKPRTDCQPQAAPHSPRSQHLPGSGLLQGPENWQAPPLEKTTKPSEDAPGSCLLALTSPTPPLFWLCQSLLGFFVPFLYIQPLAFLSCMLLSWSLSHTTDGETLLSSSCSP